MGSSEEELIRRIQSDMLDSYDEELEMEMDDRNLEALADGAAAPRSDADLQSRRQYFRELFRMQGELVKLQDWVVATGRGCVETSKDPCLQS